MLMIPNMYKIAGELTSASSTSRPARWPPRACRFSATTRTSWRYAPPASPNWSPSSVQEAHDFALIAQASTLESRIPFIHFFDGFRTSHEVNKVILLTDAEIRAMIRDDLVIAHRQRATQPGPPVHARHGAKPRRVFSGAARPSIPTTPRTPGIVEHEHGKNSPSSPAASTGCSSISATRRRERVIIIMGSGAETVRETVEYLQSRGEKVGVIQVHLYRPFSAQHLLAAIPGEDPRHRRAGPDQGTRRHRRAAVPRRGDRVHRGERRRGTADPGHAPMHRRTLRSVLEGIHARDGQGRLRRAGEGTAEEPLHHRHQRRPRPHQPRIRPAVSSSSPTACSAPCSTAWAPTAPWAPTRTPSRSSARIRTSTPRATSSTIPRSRDRRPISHLRFGPEPDPLEPIWSSRRTSSAATSSTSWSRSTFWRTLPPGRPSC